MEMQALWLYRVEKDAFFWWRLRGMTEVLYNSQTTKVRQINDCANDVAAVAVEVAAAVVVEALRGAVSNRSIRRGHSQ